MTESQLAAALRAAWCAETSDHPELWTRQNPARCQCGSTAVVVREIDFTRDQFRGGEVLGIGVPGEPASVTVRPEAHVRLLDAVRLQLSPKARANAERS